MDSSMDSLHGKHAIVTGASRGIGLAIARTLHAHGARVTLMARDAEALRAAALALGFDTNWQVADVTDPASVLDAFARVGSADILVNNAGQAASSPFMKTDAALWQRMLDANLNGAFHCIQAALPAMLDAGWGASSTSLPPPASPATATSPPTARPSTGWSASRARWRSNWPARASP
jgi:NAD(P)-dependent dehydrogenase (short-subunit alcohol dehydrogenase family)